MQLIEYFVWNNQKNKKTNEILSRIASFIITIQPATLMLMIENINTRNNLLIFYGIFLLCNYIYKNFYHPMVFNISVGENGHLTWEWMNYKGYGNIFPIVYLLLYVFTILNINNMLLSGFVIITLLMSLFFYLKDQTYSTMWCWLGNFFLLFIIIEILLIKPFYEYNGLC